MDAHLDQHILQSASQVQDAYQQDAQHGHQRAAVASSAEDQSSHGQHQSPAFDTHSALDDASYSLSTRWWYASTAFPLITSTFGPMANAFSICALVQNWREVVGPGNTVPDDAGQNIPDPSWLIAVNAVSLVLALIANLSLLLNMAKRVPFAVAQPITIGGFWVSSVLLIVLVAVVPSLSHVAHAEYQALTQAYYYACFAAGIYQIIAYLMCVTVYGAMMNKYSSEFHLTVAQRTLMLQTISLLTYLLLGALVFSKVEGWRYLDAVYFCDFTMVTGWLTECQLTVGIGDFAPLTHLGKGLLFPFAMGAIVILGLVVSSIRTLVLDRGKEKMSARMVEKNRKKVVNQLRAFIEDEKQTELRIRGIQRAVTDRLAAGAQDGPVTEFERRGAEFHAMRRVQALSRRQQKWTNLLMSMTAFAVLWFCGALVFWYTEKSQQNWTYFETLYFSYTSLLTIGYGDFAPVSNAGKPFFVFWSLLAIPSLTILISDMGDTVIKAVKDITIWLGEITILPADQGGLLDRLEHGLAQATRLVSRGQGDLRTTSAQAEGRPTLPAVSPIPPTKDDADENLQKSTGHRQDETDRLVQGFASLEQVDEGEAHKHGDAAAEAEHHYRHLLLSQIRRVYADTSTPHPKQYTYEEWAFFLQLLGEDESASEYHRLAPPRRRSSLQRRGRQKTDDSHFSSAGSEGAIGGWSWIGPQSPLMSDRSEPDLLLDMLFQRLEDSMRGIDRQKDELTTRRWHNGLSVTSPR